MAPLSCSYQISLRRKAGSAPSSQRPTMRNRDYGRGRPSPHQHMATGGVGLEGRARSPDTARSAEKGVIRVSPAAYLPG
jgi:hypothetical protein